MPCKLSAKLDSGIFVQPLLTMIATNNAVIQKALLKFVAIFASLGYMPSGALLLL